MGSDLSILLTGRDLAAENAPAEVFVRIGGNAVTPLSTDELLLAGGEDLPALTVFRAPNGDWYKRARPFGGDRPGRGGPRVVVSRHLFVGTNPPPAEKVLLLPVNAGPGTPESEDDRLKLILKRIRYPEGRVHLDVGDKVESDGAKFFVVDVMPEGGGLITQGTHVFSGGEPLAYAHRVKFVPEFGIASETDRERFRTYLSRDAGEMLLKKNRPVIDEFNKPWLPHELDVDSDYGCVLSIQALVSIEWQSVTLPPVQCAHCFREVTLPSPDFSGFAFACPLCGFLVANPHFRVWMEADLASTTPARQLLMRLRGALSDFHRDDPRVLILESLMLRLPRIFDGTLDWRALDEVAVRVLTAPLDGRVNEATPSEVLASLPVSAYESRPGSDPATERCEICLEAYVDDVPVRTLPCFHRFHETCSTSWLQVSKQCPLCKTPVDVSGEALLNAIHDDSTATTTSS